MQQLASVLENASDQLLTLQAKKTSDVALDSLQSPSSSFEMITSEEKQLSLTAS